MAGDIYHPYSSAVPFFQEDPLPGIPELDQHRVRSYNLYEQFYWNHTNTFRLLQRGEDEAPIYLPTSKRIVEATHRFLGVDFDFVVSNATGTADGQNVLATEIKNLFKREQFYVKYNSQKRFGLIRGDAIWHITADDTKEEGSRISIHAVHPARYFPIFHEDNPERVIGCHLVDTVPDPKDKTKQVNRRQTYRKTLDANGSPTGQITSELALFEIGKWDDRFLEPQEIKQIQVLRPPTPLPPAITSIPVYHIRNTWESGWAFGSSLLRGVETIIAAANQAVSDESLALAIHGLGHYWTDASPPVDPASQLPTAWEIGPLRMTEVPQGRQVGRLQGVSSVEPSQDHINFLVGEAQSGAGVPDIAAGKVDVSVAESGISLRLQLAPILASNAEREQTMLAVYDQMFFDLTTMWYPAYESFTTDGSLECVVGDPLPSNREAQIKEITDLLTAKAISVEEARTKLIELGWEIEAKADGLIAEQKAMAEATDTFGKRVAEELGGEEGEAEPAGEGSTPPKAPAKAR
jgi:hypothetical protein